MGTSQAAIDASGLTKRYGPTAAHRRGWTLVRNPDGTTTAWNRDRSKLLRSHSPPARAG